MNYFLRVILSLSKMLAKKIRVIAGLTRMGIFIIVKQEKASDTVGILDSGSDGTSGHDC